MDTLEAEIKRLEKEHFKTRSEGLHKTLLRKRNQYNTSNTYKTERALLRTRQKYYELGDKGNKLLAWQLKKQMSASMIHKVKKTGNTTTCNPKEINDCFQEFYKSLYSSEFENTANILPRLAYLFQSIPADLPDSFFNKYNNMVGKFIWCNKVARIKSSTLCLPIERGGLGLPDMQLYYWAAQFRPIFYWFGGN